MIEARLLDLLIKGDRLDEINAEEVLERRAAAQTRAAARRRFLRCLGQQVAAQIWRPWQTAVGHASVATK